MPSRTLIESFSGSIPAGTEVYGRTNMVLLEFTSDGYGVRRGINITWETCKHFIIKAQSKNDKILIYLLVYGLIANHQIIGIGSPKRFDRKTSHSMLLSQFGLARYLQLMISTYHEQTIHRMTNQSDTILYQCMSLQRTMMELCSNGRNLLHGPLNVSTHSERNTMITMCSMRGKTGGTFILVNQ